LNAEQGDKRGGLCTAHRGVESMLIRRSLSAVVGGAYANVPSYCIETENILWGLKKEWVDFFHCQHIYVQTPCFMLLCSVMCSFRAMGYIINLI